MCTALLSPAAALVKGGVKGVGGALISPAAAMVGAFGKKKKKPGVISESGATTQGVVGPSPSFGGGY